MALSMRKFVSMRHRERPIPGTHPQAQLYAPQANNVSLSYISAVGITICDRPTTHTYIWTSQSIRADSRRSRKNLRTSLGGRARF